MRDTPVIVFVNKMDRDGKDPFDLLDELEEKLNIDVRPLTWPINMGSDFKGVYNLVKKDLNLFAANKTSIQDEYVAIEDLESDALARNVGESDAKQLRDDVELIEGVYETLDEEAYRKAQIAPVFFGSALNNFGIQELLETFIQIAPKPQFRVTEERKVLPEEKKLSGFIFKIHANLDPNHRDRIAFFRICSGIFERNKFYYHTRLGKKLRFQELVNLDPMKSKQLEKGIEQLTDEGVAQLFRIEPGNRKIIGTVGELQFEVIQYRLTNEYGASCRFERKAFHKACWLTGDESKIKEFVKFKNNIARDKDGTLVFLAETPFTLQMAIQNNPEIIYNTTKEFRPNKQQA